MSEKELSEVDFDSLRFIRIFTPVHIPKVLIEQVRHREFDVEDWYRYQGVICTRQTDQGPQLNPLSMLYVIADEGNKVVGMLWCEIDVLSKILIVQTFSMDKKYWLRGKAMELLSKKAKEILEECKLKKIIWCTNYPKHSERYGFKRSKTVLMEYKGEEDGEKRGSDEAFVANTGDGLLGNRGYPDGGREAQGERAIDDAGAGSGTDGDDSGIGAGSTRCSEPILAAV